MKANTFIAFNTAFAAAGGFLMVVIGLYVTGVGIDFEKQGDVFLPSTLIFGVYGLIAGFVNSGLAWRVLACIFVALGFVLRVKDKCIIMLVNGLDELFSRRP